MMKGERMNGLEKRLLSECLKRQLFLFCLIIHPLFVLLQKIRGVNYNCLLFGSGF